MSADLSYIRNFCIIAHIDHGKSTLADRLLEMTHTLSARQMQAQVLDDMDLERERGITIKSHAIQMEYSPPHPSRREGEIASPSGGSVGAAYILNLIDTPGHVDFSYEVSRSIAACEGTLLVVDATQGIQAQTISNLYLAMEHNLKIIPVLNKIDLESARVEEVKDEIVDLVGCKRDEIILASAKEGTGVEKILSAIIERIPPPDGKYDAPLQALIFDSVFDSYRGVIAYFRVFNGTIRKGNKIKFMSTDKIYQVEETGILRMKKIQKEFISAGDVGYVIAGIKQVKEVKVGDTITHAENPCKENVKGFRDVKPMVFAGIFPTATEDFENLRSSLEKLQLNDSALVYEPETSTALGFGFRAGFLGMLHMDIVRERLEREFNMTIIMTVPNVQYRIIGLKGEESFISNPSEMPEPHKTDHVEEPFILTQIITASDYIGNIMKLCIDRRGIFKNQTYLTTTRVDLSFEMPLSEIVFDFYDKLKTISRGYASLDYQFIGFRESYMVKLDILLNGDSVDALSAIVHRDKAYDWGKKICVKLRELLPRQLFEIAIQAAIGSKVIARETVSAMRKNVLAKCYGGDITRKRKLLEKQKKGKKRMKQVGNVEIPQEAFFAVLKIEK